jgi:hypothetical protein
MSARFQPVLLPILPHNELSSPFRILQYMGVKAMVLTWDSVEQPPDSEHEWNSMGSAMVDPVTTDPASTLVPIETRLQPRTAPRTVEQAVHNLPSQWRLFFLEALTQGFLLVVLTPPHTPSPHTSHRASYQPPYQQPPTGFTNVSWVRTVLSHWLGPELMTQVQVEASPAVTSPPSVAGWSTYWRTILHHWCKQTHLNKHQLLFLTHDPQLVVPLRTRGYPVLYLTTSILESEF